MKALSLATIAALTALATPAQAQSTDSLGTAIKADYDASLGKLWTWFHQNPELSFKEVATAARLAQELRAIPGVEVTEKFAGTGIVGVIRNGTGPVVLVRADMDGLPVEEKTGLPYASKARQAGPDGTMQPVMHACGHDVHMTALVGTAKRLVAMRDRWAGTVVLVGQPAEEVTGGAKQMVAAGLYSRFPKPDYALALHVAADLPAGKVAASETIQYSSADAVDITVQGVGTHGASPQLGKDPIYMGAQIVEGLQGIISRYKGPLSPGVITVGSFHGGTKHNIIPDSAHLQITVRANDEKTRAFLLDQIAQVARGVGVMNGMPADRMPIVKVSEGTPTTINDTPLARRLNTALAAAMPGAVVPFEQRNMGAEDFTYFVTPGLGPKGYYFAVGGTDPAWIDAAAKGGPAIAGHHSPLFKIAPEPAVRVGTEAMTRAVLELLKKA